VSRPFKVCFAAWNFCANINYGEHNDGLLAQNLMHIISRNDNTKTTLRYDNVAAERGDNHQ